MLSFFDEDKCLNLSGVCRFSKHFMVPKHGQYFSPYTAEAISSGWSAIPRPALAVALRDVENGNGRGLYELNDPVAASTGKNPSDNVFHRSMIGSMASTAVRSLPHANLLGEN